MLKFINLKGTFPLLMVTRCSGEPQMDNHLWGRWRQTLGCTHSEFCTMVQPSFEHKAIYSSLLRDCFQTDIWNKCLRTVPLSLVTALFFPLYFFSLAPLICSFSWHPVYMPSAREASQLHASCSGFHLPFYHRNVPVTLSSLGTSPSAGKSDKLIRIWGY